MIDNQPLHAPIKVEDQHTEVPRLSVAVANYNYARFLPQALDSVLGQTFSDFELIVVDNASTDESRGILQDYAKRDSRIRLILRDTNQGYLASMTKACDIAKGDYLVHLDADDWVLTPSAFGEQVELLDANPEVVLVYSSLTMIGPDGNTAFVARPYSHDVVLAGEDALEAILRFNLNISGMMLRMDAYRKTDGYTSMFGHIADMQMAAKLCEEGNVGYFDRQMYAFRQHGGNMHLEPQLRVVRNEVLPVIESAFEGPLGVKIPESSTVRRRVTRNALVHLPTQYIFRGEYARGWRLYWESVRAMPFSTVAQSRTLSLLSRTLLGARGHASLTKAVHRVTRRPTQ